MASSSVVAAAKAESSATSPSPSPRSTPRAKRAKVSRKAFDPVEAPIEWVDEFSSRNAVVWTMELDGTSGWTLAPDDGVSLPPSSPDPATRNFACLSIEGDVLRLSSSDSPEKEGSASCPLSLRAVWGNPVPALCALWGTSVVSIASIQGRRHDTTRIALSVSCVFVAPPPPRGSLSQRLLVTALATVALNQAHPTEPLLAAIARTDIRTAITDVSPVIGQATLDLLNASKPAVSPDTVLDGSIPHLAEGQKLFHYQRQCLYWMLAREGVRSTSLEAQPSYRRLLEQRAPPLCVWLPGVMGGVEVDVFGRWFRVGAAAHLVSPHLSPGLPLFRGGLLASEMGLGKTIITLALVACAPALSEWLAEPDSERLRTGATLICVPSNLQSQWRHEAKLFFPGLRVLSFDRDRAHWRKGSCLTTGESSSASSLATAEAERLRSADVVLASFPAIEAELHMTGAEIRETRQGSHAVPLSPLRKLHWWRVVMDEAQAVKGKTVKSLAVVCNELLAHSRWCVTGTPVGAGGGGVEEMNGLLAFLRHPWADPLPWKSGVLPLLRRSAEMAQTVLESIVLPVFWRHEAADVDSEHGLKPHSSWLIRAQPSVAEAAAIEAYEAGVSRGVSDFVRRLVRAPQVTSAEARNRFAARLTRRFQQLMMQSSYPSTLGATSDTPLSSAALLRAQRLEFGKRSEVSALRASSFALSAALWLYRLASAISRGVIPPTSVEEVLGRFHRNVQSIDVSLESDDSPISLLVARVREIRGIVSPSRLPYHSTEAFRQLEGETLPSTWESVPHWLARRARALLLLSWEWTQGVVVWRSSFAEEQQALEAFKQAELTVLATMLEVFRLNGSEEFDGVEAASERQFTEVLRRTFQPAARRVLAHCRDAIALLASLTGEPALLAFQVPMRDFEVNEADETAHVLVGDAVPQSVLEASGVQPGETVRETARGSAESAREVARGAFRLLGRESDAFEDVQRAVCRWWGVGAFERHELVLSELHGLTPPRLETGRDVSTPPPSFHVPPPSHWTMESPGSLGDAEVALETVDETSRLCLSRVREWLGFVLLPPFLERSRKWFVAEALLGLGRSVARRSEHARRRPLPAESTSAEQSRWVFGPMDESDADESDADESDLVVLPAISEEGPVTVSLNDVTPFSGRGCHMLDADVVCPGLPSEASLTNSASSCDIALAAAIVMVRIAEVRRFQALHLCYRSVGLALSRVEGATRMSLRDAWPSVERLAPVAVREVCGQYCLGNDGHSESLQSDTMWVFREWETELCAADWRLLPSRADEAVRDANRALSQVRVGLVHWCGLTGTAPMVVPTIVTRLGAPASLPQLDWAAIETGEVPSPSPIPERMMVEGMDQWPWMTSAGFVWDMPLLSVSEIAQFVNSTIGSLKHWFESYVDAVKSAATAIERVEVQARVLRSQSELVGTRLRVLVDPKVEERSIRAEAETQRRLDRVASERKQLLQRLVQQIDQGHRVEVIPAIGESVQEEEDVGAVDATSASTLRKLQSVLTDAVRMCVDERALSRRPPLEMARCCSEAVSDMLEEAGQLRVSRRRVAQLDADMRPGSDVTRQDSAVCPIGLCPIQDGVMCPFCGTTYERENLAGWTAACRRLSQDPKCPTCKRAVSDEEWQSLRDKTSDAKPSVAREAECCRVSPSDWPLLALARRNDVAASEGDQVDSMREEANRVVVNGEDKGIGSKLCVLVARLKLLDKSDSALVLSKDVGLLSLLERWLKRNDVRAVTLRGRGKRTADVVARFQRHPGTREETRPRVLLLDFRTDASGLTLTAANYVFLLEPFNLQDERQALARALRLGQTKHVHLIRVTMRGTMEELVLAQRERLSGGRCGGLFSDLEERGILGDPMALDDTESEEAMARRSVQLELERASLSQIAQETRHHVIQSAWETPASPKHRRRASKRRRSSGATLGQLDVATALTSLAEPDDDDEDDLFSMEP
jgi:hypothetical protein